MRPVARRRDRSPARQWPTQRRTTTGSSWLAVLGVVGLFVSFFVTRRVTEAVAPVLYRWADADHGRLVALLMVLWATAPLLVLGALELRRRERPWAAWVCWVPAGLVALVVVGCIPGRGDDGERERDLTEAMGGSPLVSSGGVMIAAAVAALIAYVVVCPLLAAWTLEGGDVRRTAKGRLVVGALVYVAGWVGAGVVVLAVVGDTEPRSTWLEDTAEVLAGRRRGRDRRVPGRARRLGARRRRLRHRCGPAARGRPGARARRVPTGPARGRHRPLRPRRRAHQLG